jgi:hypothetical protein
MLKIFIEGYEKINSYIILSNCKWDFSYVSNAETIKDTLSDVIKDLDEQDLKKLLVFWSGLDSVGAGLTLSVDFNNNDEYKVKPFTSSSCSSTLHVNIPFFDEFLQNKDTLKKKMKETLKIAVEYYYIFNDK